MQHDPVHAGALTVTEPSTGELVNASFLIPRTEADLVKRREAVTAWNGYSHGFLGRTGDYMNSALTAARADLDTYLQSATTTAERRARLFKLALDASVSGFAGRETLYEYYFFGDPVRMAGAMVAGYDREPARARVRRLLEEP
jgi:aromatic ring hydroxylase